MITDLDTLKLFMDIDVTDDTQDDVLNLFLNGVETKVLTHCDRTSFNSTTYTNEMYSGNGSDHIWLKNCPIISIASASIGRLDAINIKNTDTTASNATVSVSVADAKMTLTLTGGANPGSDEVAFGTYTTLSAVVTQINTLSAKSWAAEIADSSLNDLASTELLQVDGKYVGSRRGVTASWSAIQIPDDPLGDFRSDNDTGELYRSSGWPAGFQNLIFTYTAGYATADMPGDLILAVLRWAKIACDRVEESGDGLASLTAGQTMRYLEDIPDVVLVTLEKYRRVSIA